MQRRALTVRVGIHTTHGGQHAQPIVSLSFVGTNEKVSNAELEFEGIQVILV